ILMLAWNKRKRNKKAAKEGWTVVTHIEGRNKKTHEVERGRLLVQMRS
nr:hypothetical protein [Tanacetum cinerariifolium]